MLAIVIPYYKIDFINETLESLSKQIDKRFKVYIGDDASENGIDTTMETYKNDLSINFKRFEKNLGGSSLTQQWERCINLINDEKWILILGDDDILGRNCVEEFYKNLHNIEAQKINVVRYASNVIDAEGVSISETFCHPIIEKSTDYFYRKLRKYTRGSLSEHIFRKEAYEKIKFKDFPLGWHSDDLAWLEFSNFKNTFVLNNAVVSIRYSDQSISGDQSNLELKQDASFMFYKCLVFNKLHYFNNKQTIAIIEKYEELLKERKGSFILSKIKIAYHHIKLKSSLKIKRLIKNM